MIQRESTVNVLVLLTYVTYFRDHHPQQNLTNICLFQLISNCAPILPTAAGIQLLQVHGESYGNSQVLPT